MIDDSDKELISALSAWHRKFQYAELYNYKDHVVFINHTTKEPNVLYTDLEFSQVLGELSNQGWRVIGIWYIHIESQGENSPNRYASLQIEFMNLDLAVIEKWMEKIIRGSIDDDDNS